MEIAPLLQDSVAVNGRKQKYNLAVFQCGYAGPLAMTLLCEYEIATAKVRASVTDPVFACSSIATQEGYSCL